MSLSYRMVLKCLRMMVISLTQSVLKANLIREKDLTLKSATVNTVYFFASAI